MPNLESGHNGENNGGGEFDLVLWIGLQRSSMMRALGTQNQGPGGEKSKTEEKIKNLADENRRKLENMTQDPVGKIFQATAKLFYVSNLLCAETDSNLMDTMPRKQNLNKIYLRWDENDMNQEVSSVMEGHLSILASTTPLRIELATFRLTRQRQGYRALPAVLTISMHFGGQLQRTRGSACGMAAPRAGIELQPPVTRSPPRLIGQHAPLRAVFTFYERKRPHAEACAVSEIRCPIAKLCGKPSFQLEDGLRSLGGDVTISAFPSNQVVCLYHVLLNGAHRYCKLQLIDFNGHEKPLHAQKVTVWCAVSSTGIIGPFFFENEAGNAVTVNSVRYVEMIQNFFTPQLAHFPVSENTLFQQNGATSHTARISMDAVNALFPGRVISRKGDVAWPPRSPDLTVCDFFLWGHLKTKVFGGNLTRTIPALQQRIREEVAAIPVSMLRGVMQQFVAKLEECVRLPLTRKQYRQLKKQTFTYETCQTTICIPNSFRDIYFDSFYANDEEIK
ncbi:hypothetical protein ANN_24306 [Periplaneta americana]|uniref:Uncharacterized protein n=1 Tax=Periplaneta americana TaxID=6978 RepID=A0ABQ8S2R4_PERAM|nr:hypothetical protein ANN_24306 [Periplaneta americana]